MSEDENDNGESGEWSGSKESEDAKDSEDDEDKQDDGELIKKDDEENDKIKTTHVSIEKLMSPKISHKQLLEPNP